jgi:predicted AAA+ superfamily ATPase
MMKICIIYLKVPISHTSFSVGKVEFMNMHPMTFSEFLLADNAKNLVDYMQSLEKVEKKQIYFSIN